MLVRKGDTVEVLAGKDKGKRGAVERVIIADHKLVVAGINLMKRHMKPSNKYPSGGIVEMAFPIDQSNVMVVNPDNDQPSRSRSERDGKTARRVFKKSAKATKASKGK